MGKAKKSGRISTRRETHGGALADEILASESLEMRMGGKSQNTASAFNAEGGRRSKKGEPALRFKQGLFNGADAMPGDFSDEEEARAERGARTAAAASMSGPGGASKASGFVPESMSRKILQSARAQQAEVAAEDGFGGPGLPSLEGTARMGGTAAAARAAAFAGDDDLDDYDAGPADDGLGDMGDDTEAGYMALDDADVIGMTAEEAQDLAMFAPMSRDGPGNAQGPTIADLIMEALAKHNPMPDQPAKRMDPKVVQVYRGVGKLLSRYTSGKIPKAFKIIPTLKNWEEIVVLTAPDQWSPSAMREATRIFASNLKPKQAQRFYNMVLLPMVQDDIRDNYRLNWHLYQALRKALFKPAAFFKGIILPLAESGTTSVREATILCSVLAKSSIPVLHSAVALMKLAELPYQATTDLFIRTLLNKGYSLPIPVIIAVMGHFMDAMPRGQLSQEDIEMLPPMPVLWHQTLLVFVQRYKTELTGEQREGLKMLLRVRQHHAITPEIRRELFAKQSGEAAAPMVFDRPSWF